VRRANVPVRQQVGELAGQSVSPAATITIGPVGWWRVLIAVSQRCCDRAIALLPSARTRALVPSAVGSILLSPAVAYTSGKGAAFVGQGSVRARRTCRGQEQRAEASVPEEVRFAIKTATTTVTHRYHAQPAHNISCPRVPVAYYRQR
jgi:hypothetical protein